MIETIEPKLTASEARLMNAARNVFIKKGLEGATLQEIADEAGISRTALHYYFRNKEKLFNAVFDYAVKELVPKINDIVEQDLSIEEKIRLFVSVYLDIMQHNPSLPIFIIQELRRHPESIMIRIKAESRMISITKIINQLDAEQKAGNLRQCTLPDFLSNLMGLCLFPFIARPVLDELFFQYEDEIFHSFIENRKSVIIETMMAWLTTKNR